MGSWIYISTHGSEFLCFTYVDGEKGLCAKGGPPEQEDLASRPSMTLHFLPWPNAPWRYVSAAEIRRRGLPGHPEWLQHYGPQPSPGTPWESLSRKDWLRRYGLRSPGAGPDRPAH